jgi:dihydroorotate dehydrogenase electron transfer subunit
MSAPKYLNAKIMANTEIAPGIFSMTVYAPEIENVHPGQFAMFYLNKGELLLPRPISVCDAGDERLRFVYHVVGKGTEAMANMQNSTVKILAPLGKGFFTSAITARSSLKNVALIGGGIGTPPLLYLAKKLKEQGAKVNTFLGFRSRPILHDEFKSIVDNLHIATEDGSAGHKGNILEVLQASQNKSYDEFLACGPRPMLNALAAFAHKQNIPCQLSTEERMACGIGTCVGCVLKINGTYLRICTEGPVFYSDTISEH